MTNVSKSDNIIVCANVRIFLWTTSPLFSLAFIAHHSSKNLHYIYTSYFLQCVVVVGVANTFNVWEGVTTSQLVHSNQFLKQVSKLQNFQSGIVMKFDCKEFKRTSSLLVSSYLTFLAVRMSWA